MKNNLIKGLLSKLGVPGFLILCLFITQLLNSEVGILRVSNLRLVFQQSAVLILVSLGLSLVMIGGETDLSIAGSIGFIGAIFVTCVESQLGLWVAITMTIVASLLIGVFNGFIVSKLGYSSFLVTIATMFVTMGLQNVFTGGLTVWIKDSSIINLGTTTILGIPVFIFVFFAVAIIHYILVYHTKWGFNVRVVGENPTAANEVGIDTKLVKFLIFVVAAIFYGIAGVIESIRVSGSVIYSGQAMLLPAMAACYLGSTMFIPGKVNVAGTLFSALFLSFILNILTLLSVRYYFVTLIQGLLLIVAVVISNMKNRSIKQIII